MGLGFSLPGFVFRRPHKNKKTLYSTIFEGQGEIKSHGLPTGTNYKRSPLSDSLYICMYNMLVNVHVRWSLIQNIFIHDNPLFIAHSRPGGRVYYYYLHYYYYIPTVFSINDCCYLSRLLCLMHEIPSTLGCGGLTVYGDEHNPRAE